MAHVEMQRRLRETRLQIAPNGILAGWQGEYPSGRTGDEMVQPGRSRMGESSQQPLAELDLVRQLAKFFGVDAHAVTMQGSARSTQWSAAISAWEWRPYASSGPTTTRAVS